MPNMLHRYFSEVSDFNGNMVMNMPMAPSSLINDTTSITLDMEPGKTYLIRMVSVAALFAHKVSFEDHGELCHSTSLKVYCEVNAIRHDHCRHRWNPNECDPGQSGDYRCRTKVCKLWQSSCITDLSLQVRRSRQGEIGSDQRLRHLLAHGSRQQWRFWHTEIQLKVHEYLYVRQRKSCCFYPH